MNAPISPTPRSSRRAAPRDADGDDFLGEDIGYPNPKAQRRGHRLLLAFIVLAAIVALVGGALQSGDRIMAAFPTAQSLTEGAAWATFFSGIGRLAAIGLIVLVAVLFLRWRIRRAHRRAKK